MKYKWYLIAANKLSPEFIEAENVSYNAHNQYTIIFGNGDSVLFRTGITAKAIAPANKEFYFCNTEEEFKKLLFEYRLIKGH